MMLAKVAHIKGAAASRKNVITKSVNFTLRGFQAVR